MNVDLVKAFQLADSVFPFENQVDPDPIKEGLDGLRIIEPIHYKGEIYKVEGSYLIQADIKYKYEAKCDRCYETTIKEVSTSLSGRLEDNESVFEEDEEDQDEDGANSSRNTTPSKQNNRSIFSSDSELEDGEVSDSGTDEANER